MIEADTQMDNKGNSRYTYDIYFITRVGFIQIV